MTDSAERVFIVGGTGNIGVKTVNHLLAKKVPVTVYTRSISKATSLFPADSNLSFVEGDFNDYTPLKESIKSHSRLFLLVGDVDNIAKIKKAVATYAYEAGIKQIVGISSISVSNGWRSNYDNIIHAEGEKVVLNIPNRGTFVALRLGRFMCNVFNYNNPTSDGKVMDIFDGNIHQAYISPDDVGAIAANILTDNIAKHGDYVYELVGDTATPIELAQIVSKITGCQVKYQKMSALDRYNFYISLGFSHKYAYGLISVNPTEPGVSFGIPILLGREPEKLEQYLTLNKSKL